MSQNIAASKISIIIPAINEAGNIQDAIATTQPSTNIEVIVVDGGSGDNTVAIAQSLDISEKECRDVAMLRLYKASG